jgi:16S rRNA (cytosine1402-N4)-methyltransferase
MVTLAPNYHQPVLLAEVLETARGARRVVDGTLGDGGHAEALLGTGAELLAIDRDPDAIRIARSRLGENGIRYLQASHSSGEALAEIVDFRPDFILLDLGVSSRQFDDAARGFTFRPGAPLDMRMGDDGPTAADLLNTASKESLRAWFADWGDERRAHRLAGEMVRRRERAAFATSDDFVYAIRGVLGSQSGPDDFARLFQAIRIAVNEELEGLAEALPALRDALIPDGVLAIISYHSGEDRLVKHAFREWSRACICPPEFPVCQCRGRPLGIEKPRGGVVPGPEEIAANPRARSARLRIFRAAHDV